jgi:hypothetical protein
MLENNFCCVWIADLSNCVFVSMETTDITFVFKFSLLSVYIKAWHLVIKSVIWKSLWPKENFQILAWYEMHLYVKCFIFVSMFFFEDVKWGCLVAMVTIIRFFPWQPWTLFKFSLLSVEELTLSYKISSMETFVTKRNLIWNAFNM